MIDLKTYSGHGQKRSILLVDDDMDIRTALAEVLESADFKVVQASDAMKAIDILRNRPSPWFALITDFYMPEVDGGELIKSVREIGIDFQAIILISSADRLDFKLRDFLKRENVTYLHKPFEAEELLRYLKVPDVTHTSIIE